MIPGFDEHSIDTVLGAVESGGHEGVLRAIAKRVAEEIAALGEECDPRMLVALTKELRTVTAEMNSMGADAGAGEESELDIARRRFAERRAAGGNA